jgi:type IV pilus assembly protein PilF
MRAPGSRQFPSWPGPCAWLGLALIWVGLAGCATSTGADWPTAQRSGGDIMTASDEPETRKRARIRLELALGYFEQGQTTVALDELKQALAIDPAFAPTHNLRGLIYMRLNDLRTAEEGFRRALQLSPRDPAVMHNLAWLLCQQSRWPEAYERFEQALADPQYVERAKTFRALGLCQARAGRLAEAERSLVKSFELDAGNPVTSFNLASLMFQRGELAGARFHLRRLNNSELANAETLWLGIKVERALDSREAVLQLSSQLIKRFPQSRETAAFQRGAFDE